MAKRIAIIYWFTRSVGGIATRLNSLRLAAMQCGDKCDILISKNNSTKPQVFKDRRWTHGGDTKIWIDGNAPHGDNWKQTVKWLEKNYDGIVFGFLCPHQCKTCPDPVFMRMYESVNLPMVSYICDGFWDKYKDWGNDCIPYLNKLFCTQPGFGKYLEDEGIEVTYNPTPVFPRVPLDGGNIRSKTPLLIWPCQWKNIKGINEFLEIVPKLPAEVEVELFSSGIRYYQLRTTDVWKKAVNIDHFSGYNGNGRADYLANIDIPDMAMKYRQAWFTVNLQGMSGKRNGVYHNTEMEALLYGACPILHTSVRETDLPKAAYIAVDSAEEIPAAVKQAISSGFAISKHRQKLAKDFIEKVHDPIKHYNRVKKALFV